MPLPTDHFGLPGRALAASLVALLAACQPSGGERVVADAAAAAAPTTAPAHTSKPLPAITPAPTPFQSPTASKPLPAPAPAPPGPAPATGADPGTVSLAIGEEQSIAAETRLRLLRVVNDSRCPKDVQCIWAGEVTLEFELTRGRDKTRFELAQVRNPRTSAKGMEFELTGFGACPSGQGRMADAECASVAISAPADR